MNEDDFLNQVYPEIPPDFHSFETGKPFTSCIECKLPLIDDVESVYTITKAIQNDEVLLEWAMCKDCLETFRGELSEESTQALEAFVAKAKAGDGHFTKSIEEKMSYCYICTKKRGAMKGYTIQALCSGQELINFRAPILICHDCEESANELISKATRDHYDRFMDDHFSGPPGAALDAELLRKLVTV